MKTLLHTIITVLICLTCVVADAQPPVRFNRLTKEDGLSSDVVYDLHQDRNGFLWIATHGGLDRYDGYRFRHYRYDPHDNKSISGNYVHCIKEDGNGILWLTNNNGLNSLDPLTGEVKRFVPSPATMPKDMGDILLVNDSILLVTAITTVYVFNKQQQRFREIALPQIEDGPQLMHKKFITGYKDLILLTRGNKSGECLSIDWKRNKAELITVPGLQRIPGDIENVRALELDDNGNVLCFSDKASLLLTKKSSGKGIDYPFFNVDYQQFENTITDFYEEQERLWICSGAGLVYYDYAQRKFYRYTEQPGNNASLSNNRVQCMVKDKTGLYWVGTFGGGVCYFRLNAVFKNIVVDSSYYDGERKIYGLRPLHSGRIIVGTMSYRQFLLEKDKSLHVLDYAKDFKTPVLLDELVQEITGKPIQTFSKNDSVVLHAYFNANCSTRPVKHFVTAQGIKNALSLATILPLHENKVWIHYSSQQLWDGTRNHRFSQVVNYFELISNNHFLFATNNGLVEFDANKDKVVKTWLPQAGDPNSIGSSWVNCILPDGNGNYWIGTADAGLDFWDVKTDRFYHFTTKEGLPDNKIYCILPDKQGRLWMSTDNGLSCFDTATRTFTNYTGEDGLINTEYNSGTACIDNEGWFYFGGMKGIDYFHPDSIREEKQPPVLQLASFKVYGKEMPLANAYELPTEDNNIYMEFTSNDFISASKLLLRYRLSDVDKDWVSVQGDNAVLYNKLPPGEYRFRVMASWDGLSWSKPLVIAVSIARPWFQSWWFYALLILAAITAIYIFFNYRLRQQLKLFQVRNRISRDLHDDVGATLSSVKAYSEILKDNPENPLIADLIKENAAEMIDRLEVIA